MDEIWVDIIGFEGLYQVSNTQKVKSLRRTKDRGIWGVSIVEERILKQNLCKDYMAVTMYKEGKQFKKKIHKLISDAFIPNPLNLPCINHIDGDKLNNSPDNLERCTVSHNNTHAYQLGLRTPNDFGGEKHPMFGRKGKDNPLFGRPKESFWLYDKKGELHPQFGRKGNLSGKSKVVLDLQTGIFYECAREAAEAKGYNRKTLQEKLRGGRLNNTNMIYA